MNEIDKPGEEWLLVCQNISRNVEEKTGQKGTLLGEVGRGFVFYPDTNKNKSEDSHSEQVKSKSVETAKQQNDIEKKSGSQDVAISQTTVTNSDTRVLPTTTNDNNVVAGHEFVDLGLSVKWATCNVGAEKPEDYGDYFAWGETSPKSEYEWENLKYRTEGNDCDNVKFSKYVASSQYGPVDNRTTLELSDDAARANWGGSWRMPTNAEFQELIDKCNWTWTTVNGKNGYKVVSKSNGNSIFLPAAGWRNDASLYGAGNSGDYWYSSLGGSTSYNARGLSFYSNYHDTYFYFRRLGRSVRPVFR